MRSCQVKIPVFNSNKILGLLLLIRKGHVKPAGLLFVVFLWANITFQLDGPYMVALEATGPCKKDWWNLPRK